MALLAFLAQRRTELLLIPYVPDWLCPWAVGLEAGLFLWCQNPQAEQGGTWGMHDTEQGWYHCGGQGWDVGPPLPWRLLDSGTQAPQQIFVYGGSFSLPVK